MSAANKNQMALRDFALDLGKSGWVTARFGPREKPPLEVLRAIDESYRAVAPKKLVAGLAGGAPAEAAKKAPATKRSATRRTAAARQARSR